MKRIVILSCFLALMIMLVFTRDLWHRNTTSGEPGKPPYLTVFLIDGMSAKIFESELHKGLLPNLGKIMESGAYIPYGITAFPSITGYAYYPFLTGRDPVDSGVLGLRWFDRARDLGNFRNYVGRTNVQMNRDLENEPPLLFEEFGNQHSFSVNSFMNRGVTESVVHNWNFSMSKFQDHWWLPQILKSIPWIGDKLVPDLIDAEAAVLEQAIEDLNHQPRIHWITFATPDAYNHLNGTDDGYIKLLHGIDELIGRYRSASQKAGQESQRIYAVISDHGVSNVNENLDLRETFIQQGLNVDRDFAVQLISQDITEELNERWAKIDAALLVNGNTMNYLYFKTPGKDGEDAWRERLDPNFMQHYPGPNGTVNLIESLLSVRGVELVASRTEDDNVQINTSTGSGVIRKQNGLYSYHILEGRDPLGYEDLPMLNKMVNQGWYDSETWLNGSYRSDFPDAIYRLHQLLTSERCGDLVVTSAAGYDLAKDFEMFVGNYRGGHGGIRSDQLRVPIILSGPGIKQNVKVETARTEQVGATIRHLLGLTHRKGDAKIIESLLISNEQNSTLN